jgi:subtilisin family serine protease
MVRMFAFLLAFAVATPAFADAPLLRTNGTRVDGEYLVAFKNPFAMQAAATQMRGMGIQINDMWEAVNGASVRMTADQLDAALRMDSVAWVEESSLYYIAADPAARSVTQAGLYGLDQIDSPTAARDNVYNPRANGAGVDVYVIDTGINPTHQQFTGRFLRGTSTVNDGRVNDCNLHGTHVSGTASGATFGVAAGTTIRDVRVFTCAGSTTNQAIIAGINYVINQETARAPRRAVANMSLGGGASAMLDQAVNRMVAGGTFTAVAAGNSNANAATTSPARAASAFAVGASTANRTRASFSNFGTTVKLFAPGNQILSAAFESNTGTRTISGTSMASPHVAGAAALFIELNPNATPGQIGNLMIQAAAVNRLTGNLGTGSPNRFLQVPR